MPPTIPRLPRPKIVTSAPPLPPSKSCHSAPLLDKVRPLRPRNCHLRPPPSANSPPPPPTPPPYSPLNTPPLPKCNKCQVTDSVSSFLSSVPHPKLGSLPSPPSKIRQMPGHRLNHLLQPPPLAARPAHLRAPRRRARLPSGAGGRRRLAAVQRVHYEGDGEDKGRKERKRENKRKRA